MAVFPDRIVLKNSTDDQATIEAAIGSGGSDEITQGEIVLGILNTDVKFYTKAGDGSIVTLGGTGTGPTILGDLTDVDLSTPATDGQVIAYNSTSGNWEPVNQTGGGGYTDPLTTDGDIVIRSGGTTTRLGIGSEGQVLTVSSGLPVWAAATGGGLDNIVEDATPQLGGNLDVNGNYIVSASGGDVVIAPDTTGNFIVRGNSTDGSITLNCTSNTHGVTIQSPPHADAATYTLVLPSSAGTAGQVLTSQGGAQLTWEDATSGGATSINDLTDVDTSTTPPTNNQTLVWDGTNWVPGAGGGGGAVDSVNGQTGVVSLGIQDMDDFELLQDNSGYGTNMGTWSTFSGSIPQADGEWQTFNGEFRLDAHNDAGTNWDAYFTPLIGAGSGSVFVSIDGATAVEVTFTDVSTGSANGDVYYRLLGANPLPSGSAVNVYQPLGVEPPSLPLADGDILQWNDTDQKFKPAQLSSGGAVDSVNGQTGVVSLGVQDMDDFELNLVFTGTVYRHVLGSYHIDGEYQVNGDGLLVKEYDADGVQSVKPTNDGTVYLSADGTSFVAATISGSVGTAGTNPGGTSNNAWNFTFVDSSIYSNLGITSGQSLYWSNENPSGTPVPLADDDILQWVASESKFKPAQLDIYVDPLTTNGDMVMYSSLAGGTTRLAAGPQGSILRVDANGRPAWTTVSIDDLSDVDTSTAAPNDGEALVWVQSSLEWQPGVPAASSLASIDDIGDVDTTTAPPSDGQVLTWDSANSQWEPATVTSGGGGTTINEAFSTDSGYIHEYSYGAANTIGQTEVIGSDIYFNWIDQNDRDTRTYISELELNGGGTVYWSTDGTTWTQYAWTSAGEISGQPRWYIGGGDATGYPSSGTVYIAFVLAPQDGSLVSPDAIAAKDGTGWASSGTLPKIEGADVNYSQTLRYDAFISNAPTAQGEIGTVPTNTSYFRVYETDADGRRVDPSKLRGNPAANSQAIPVFFLWVDGTRHRIEPINSTAQFVYQSNYYQVDTKQNISTLCSGASEIFVEIPGTPTNSASLRWNESLSRWESDPTTARVTRSTVPSTNADAGYPGEIRHDASHLYVCVEEDTWKRVAWDTW